MSHPMVPPLCKEITVACDAARAFELFTADLGAWWPLDVHSLTALTKGQVPETAVMEGRVGGRVYERTHDGVEMDWGEVRIWQPGSRVVWSWQLNMPAEHITEVEVSFREIAPGETRVRLEHRGWDVFGTTAQAQRTDYDGGWVDVFTEGFGAFAARMLGG